MHRLFPRRPTPTAITAWKRLRTNPACRKSLIRQLLLGAPWLLPTHHTAYLLPAPSSNARARRLSAQTSNRRLLDGSSIQDGRAPMLLLASAPARHPLHDPAYNVPTLAYRADRDSEPAIQTAD